MQMYIIIQHVGMYEDYTYVYVDVYTYISTYMNMSKRKGITSPRVLNSRIRAIDRITEENRY